MQTLHAAAGLPLTREADRRLVQWWLAPLGQAVRTHEDTVLTQALAGCFGFHLLQVGGPGSRESLAECRVRHRIMAGAPAALGVDVQLEPDDLPFGRDSLDVVVLRHVLEFAHSPHQVLREADRVLVNGGCVIVLGFNPYSLLAVPRLWRARGGPWGGRFLGAGRVADWLELLGFSVEPPRFYFFRPPLGNPAILQRLAGLEEVGQRHWARLGGGYLLCARKRVVPLTPVGRRRRRALVAPPVVKPTARNPHDG